MENLLMLGGGVLGGLVTGAIIVLKIVAPKTGNKVDDAVLARLEQLERLLGLLPSLPSDPAPVRTFAPVESRDHRTP